MDIKESLLKIEKLKNNLAEIIKGKDEEIELSLTTLFCRGNLLIEDVPGVGKTTLAETLAKSISLTFKRIQFTSDLLPTDVTGITIYNNETKTFEFSPGPVFANIVLADELNRTTPRTQSALLEAMNEQRITIERHTYELPKPFMLIATQNPIEQIGTYPLPESQLDRFTMSIKMGYPEKETLKEILKGKDKKKEIKEVISDKEVIEIQNLIDTVTIDDDIINYMAEIIEKTRDHDMISLGVSPRGAIYFKNAVKSYALMNGRDFATPDDVKKLAKPCLCHRIVLKGLEEELVRDKAKDVIDDILENLTVPI